MLTKFLVTFALILAVSAKPQFIVPSSWPYAANYGPYNAPLTSYPTSYVAGNSYLAPAAYNIQPANPYLGPSAAVVAPGAGVPFPYFYNTFAASSQQQVVQEYRIPAVPAPVEPVTPVVGPASYTLPAYQWVSYQR